MPSHAGQISFPGGKVDETDASARRHARCARRTRRSASTEAFVEPLGYLDKLSHGYGLSQIGAGGRAGAARLHAVSSNVDEVADGVRGAAGVPDGYETNHQTAIRALGAAASATSIAMPYGGPLHLGGHRRHAQEHACRGSFRP